MVAACPFPLARGTPIRIERMAQALAERGHQVDIYTYHHGAPRPETPFRLVRIAHGFGYRRTSPGPSLVKLALLDPQLAWKLLCKSGGERYDIIHAHHVEGLLAAQPAARSRSIPVVYDVHTLLESELPYYQSGPKALFRRIGGGIDRILPRLADHVICVSEEIHTALDDLERSRPDSISLIPNGVEEELFATRDRSPASDGLVYAGNLAPYQGFDLLIRAFARARLQRPDLRLQVITDEPLGGYERLARELGVDEAIDMVQVTLADLPATLAAGAVAANPRVDCAGLPQKLLNYMAAGCPIVSFAGSAKHIVHGSTGLIAADHDVQGFAEAVLRLLEDRELGRRLGKAAQDYARTELSWSRVGERVERVYERVLARRAG